MKHYDIITIGSGGAAKLTRPLADLGYRVASIEKDDLGGTCLNRGCIPSKMLIHPADVAHEIKHAHRFDINNDPSFTTNFEQLVTRVTNTVRTDSRSIDKKYIEHPNIDLYKATARFVDDKIIEVEGEQMTADKIFIAVGARPHIPNIPGLVGTPFMTSTEALRNTKQPKKMIVIGGGYIAAELGYFYAALGTEVHFLVRSGMLKHEDKDVREEFERVFMQDHHVHFGTTPTHVSYEHGQFAVTTTDADGTTSLFEADALLIATGVVPNSDTLSLEHTAIETDGTGNISVNDKLETTAPGVYAFGDVIGRYLFRHTVNFEGEYLMRTLFTNPSDEPIEYPPIPHAVFSNPQIGGVGVTEDELIAEGKQAGKDYIVGLNPYKSSAMGMALLSESGFCKLIIDAHTKKLIGAHIIGPEASDMIHVPIAFMNMNATLDDMLRTIYIHPALPEIVRNAARKAQSIFDERTH